MLAPRWPTASAVSSSRAGAISPHGGTPITPAVHLAETARRDERPLRVPGVVLGLEKNSIPCAKDLPEVHLGRTA
jgi:hypothetical protein